jgi:aspartate 1-decarboxylase
VRVTASDLNYEGSITIDETLMDAAGLIPHELVHVLNLNNGARAETYVIKGKKDGGEIVMNGAIAHLAQVGDPLIILSYGLMEEDQAKFFMPVIVLVDENNRIMKIKS